MEKRMRKITVPHALKGWQSLWDRFGQLPDGARYDVAWAAVRFENDRATLPAAWQHPVTHAWLKNPTLYDLSQKDLPPRRTTKEGKEEVKWYSVNLRHNHHGLKGILEGLKPALL